MAISVPEQGRLRHPISYFRTELYATPAYRSDTPWCIRAVRLTAPAICQTNLCFGIEHGSRQGGSIKKLCQILEGKGWLPGTYRQEGAGNTVATVGGGIAEEVFAAFITGKSGVISQGRELMARTKGDLPVQLPGPVTAAAPLTATVQPAMAVSALASEQTVAVEPKQP